MPGLWETLFGRGEKMQQVPTLNPMQQQGLEDVFSQLQNLGQGGYKNATDYFSKLVSGDPGALAQFEAPYRQQFEQQTIPRLAERFAGLNPMGGGLSSSGFGQALGGAGAGLQAQLAGLHGGLRQQAGNQLMNQFNNLSGLGLGTRSFENFFRPGNAGLVGESLSGALGGLSQGVGQGGGMALMLKLLPLLGVI